MIKVMIDFIATVEQALCLPISKNNSDQKEKKTTKFPINKI